MVFAEQIATYATNFWSQGAVKNMNVLNLQGCSVLHDITSSAP